MAKTDGDSTTGLSFPRETFAKLTPNAYLQAHLKSAAATRPNGRANDEFREASINTGSLAYSNGSAVVRLGDTAIVCGVRGEILLASDIPHPPRPEDTDLVQSLGLLVPNIELSTGCSPAHLPGNPPSGLAQSMSWRLYSLLHTTGLIDIDDLRIQYTQPALEDDEDAPKIVTKAYWTLYLDILCISLDGNCFDAAWIAMIAALGNTRLPKAIWNPDKELILCSPYAIDSTTLRLQSSAVPATFAVFTNASPLRDAKLTEQWTITDPDSFEEEACAETVTITVDDGGIARIEKSGGPALGPQQMRHCFELATQRRRQILQLLSNS